MKRRDPVRLTRRIALCAIVALAAGCGVMPKVGPQYAGPPGARSLAQSEAGAPDPAKDPWRARLPHGGTSSDLARWWAQFEDPALDAFLAAAQRESGTIAASAARIEQARAAAIAAGAAGLPTLNATASATRGTINIGTTILIANQLRGTFEAGWEIDLFGRLARDREASVARLDARTAEWHDARVSVAAEVAAQGRAGRFPELHAQAAELVDRAVALRRAVSETP